MGIYSVSCDALIMIFCIDEEINRGNTTHPTVKFFQKIKLILFLGIGSIFVRIKINVGKIMILKTIFI